MSDVLKGNFKLRKTVEVDGQDEDLNTRFEREALKRLGGSIAFVRKKRFLFDAAQKEKGREPDAS